MRIQLMPRLAAAALLGGCAAQPPTPPPPASPPAFRHQRPDAVVQWPSRDWYREFGSAGLDRLIEMASSGSLDLEASRARVVEADARARQAGAALLPSLDAVGAGTYYAGHSSHGSGHELDWSALLSASYELDFWGQNRATAASGLWLAQATRAESDTLALSTLAAVASAYFQAQALDQRSRIAVSNRDASHRLLDVLQARFDEGLAGPEELAAQRAAWDAAAIAALDLEQSKVEAQTVLSLLVGKPPEEFTLDPEALDALHEPAVSAGLPSELLARRPDIRQAEANLRAAHADVAVARAALLPSISLTAGAGVGNPALPATVLTIPGIGPTLALGGNLTQPIFDHGKLKARQDEAVARETGLLAVYRASILAAFADTENALAEISHLDASREAQEDHLRQSERAFAAAEARYRAGFGDFLVLLEAERTLYAARDQRVSYKLARLQARLSLCKALGGGWSAAPLTADAAHPAHSP